MDCSLTDDAFPRFTDNLICFPSGFTLPLPSLIHSAVSTEEFERHAALLFEMSGCFKRKRVEESGRDFKERRTRNRGYAIEEMKHLTDKHFKKMFRLNRCAFYHLLARIRKYLDPKPGAVSYEFYNEALQPISCEVKLAITLRWLAGGSYLDICFAFGLSEGTFFKNEYSYYLIKIHIILYKYH
jgi:hypothetical protein